LRARVRPRASASFIDVRVIGADDWRLWRALRLDALREAPYAFSSTLAEWEGAGDTEARWRARLSTVPYNVVAYLNGKPAGMVSGTATDQEATTELISMWVAPFARGRRVSDVLVAAVIRWAREQQAASITLAVYASNEHARALYRRHGFIDLGAPESAASGASQRRMVRDI
jgi:ribosomal protein S18 acetylase RimI-like enzyme